MKRSAFCRYSIAIMWLAAVISCKKEINNANTVVPPVIIDTLRETDLTTLNFTVAAEADWTQLLNRTSGWIGGDGIFSIPLSGIDSIGAGSTGKTLLVFSDTHLGEIQNGKLAPGSLIINNSVAIMEGNIPSPAKIDFRWKLDAAGNPAAVFVPATPLSAPGDYYWLGDGFVNQELQNETAIIAYKIRAVSGGFGFGVVGSSLITVPAGSAPPFENATQVDAPLFIAGDKPDNGYAFGAGIFVNTAAAGAPKPDGYVYVYGVKAIPGILNKGLMIGRVQPASFKDFSKWRFWDGTTWSLDINNIKYATVVTERVSDELSLTPLPDGRYALIFQTDVWGSVGLRIAKTPYGPFGPVIPVWDCKEALTGKDYFAYNAKAHPNLSNKGELLVSFNINSFNYLNDIQATPNLYRPRFIKIKFL